MTNVYFLLDTADSITNWSEIAAGYRNRLLLLGGTALETGGADSHTHTVAITGVGSYTTPQLTSYMSGYAADSGSPHNHGGGGSGSTTDGGSLPPYKDFRLLYRSVTGWNGAIPAHAIGFNYGDSTPTNWSSYDSAQTYFIRISATAGGTGGATSHSHTINVQTYTHSGGTTSRGNTSANTWFGINHYHGASVGSSSQSHDYYYQNAKMIHCDMDTSVVPGIILLFDGDPGATHWTAWGSDHHLLRCGNDLNTGGSHGLMTHNHGGGGSVTSGTCTNATYLRGWSTYSNIWCGHTHSISFSIANDNSFPAYVRLLAYRCTASYSAGRTFVVMGC